MSSKISIASIVSDHWLTLRNHNTHRISWIDIAIFLLLPSVLSVAAYLCGISLSDSLSNVLATAFSIFAALLFNLLLLVYDLLKKEEVAAEPNTLRQELLDEVSKNISFSILISLVVIILLIVSSLKIKAGWFEGVASAVTFWFSAVFLLTLFMILKRIHNLLVTTFIKPSTR
jgi:TRAP-type uncharacterized transport system fused permease subunit